MQFLNDIEHKINDMARKLNDMGQKANDMAYKLNGLERMGRKADLIARTLNGMGRKMNDNLGRLSDKARRLEPEHFYFGSSLALLFIIIFFSTLNKVPELKPEPLPPPTPLRQVVPPRAELAEKYKTEPTISVYRHETGGVEWMKMDDYLAGVLAAEMEPDWPVEALAAQAVVARTMTLKVIEEKSGAYQYHRTDTCTAPYHVQAYAPQKINANVREAVALSHGKVIIYQGDLIYGLYSSWSGGQTATPREGFVDFLTNPDETPYLQSVPDPWDEAVPAHLKEWSVTVPLSELRGIAGVSSGSASIAETGPSGRAVKLSIGSKTISGPQLRTWLGTSRLRSTLITGISAEGSRVRFTGRGWGHGVGLSQWGAYGQAAEGRDHLAIIRHYFRGVDIYQLWS
ncbi:MAG: SpoIID/LytB domain-containing protein [bacterium]